MSDHRVLNMFEGKYGRFFVENHTRAEPWWFSTPAFSREQFKPVLWYDAAVAPPEFKGFPFQIEFKICPEPKDTGHPQNIHPDTREAVFVLGTDPEHPQTLGGEVEFTVDGEKHLIDRPCMVSIPRGLRHGPVWFRKVDRPIIQMAILPDAKFYDQEYVTEPLEDREAIGIYEGRCGRYYQTNYKAPTPYWHFEEGYDPSQYRPILKMNDSVTPEEYPCFTFTAEFVMHADKVRPTIKAGFHEDSDAVLVFMGTDPENPRKLPARIEFTIDGETHLVDRACMVTIPKGLTYGPVRVVEAEEPFVMMTMLPQAAAYSRREV